MLSRLWLVLSLLISTGVCAATLDIVVEDPNEYAQSCGLSKGGLTSRGHLALRAGGVQTSTSEVGHLYISVAAASQAGGCMAAVLVAIRQPATLIKGAQFKAINGDALVFADVCTHGGVIVGPRNGFSKQVED